MCCIVLEFYYLCVVIGDKPVISSHKFLKYSTHNLIFALVLHFHLAMKTGERKPAQDQKV